ncbi:MAG: FAD-dependent monooxygenase, partial [Pseudomonadota bacterium]
MTVLVVGAGIAGLCAALALRPHAEVLVLERRSHVAANAGAGIQLSPNAIKALDVIGAREVVEAHSTAPRGLHIGAAGRRAPLAEIDYGLMEKRFGAPYRTASRAGLHEALLIAAAQAGITICFDTTVDTLEPSGTGWVIPDAGAGDRGGISARNGGIAPLVIAADGVSSALRQRMLDDTPTETGACAWRGTAPMAEGESSFTRLTLSRQCHLVRYVLPDARDNAVFVSSLSRPPANLGDNPITTALTGVSQWVPWPIKVQPK